MNKILSQAVVLQNFTADIRLPAWVKVLLGLLVSFLISILSGVDWKSALQTVLVALLPMLGIDRATTRQGQVDFAQLLQNLNQK